MLFPWMVFGFPGHTPAPGIKTGESGVFLGKQPGSELQALLQGRGLRGVGRGAHRVGAGGLCCGFLNIRHELQFQFEGSVFSMLD